MLFDAQEGLSARSKPTSFRFRLEAPHDARLDQSDQVRIKRLASLLGGIDPRDARR